MRFAHGVFCSDLVRPFSSRKIVNSRSTRNMDTLILNFKRHNSAVVACLAYGLGNQLFQYATAFALSRRLQLPLDLDVSWYQREASGTVARNLLALQMIGDQGYRAIITPSRGQRLIDYVRRYAPSASEIPYKHGYPMWNNRWPECADFARIKEPVCITGVPERYSYFDAYRAPLLAQLRTGLLAASKVEAPNKEYAFVHIRLGDYIKKPNVAKKMVQLNRSFYAAAMAAYENERGKMPWVLCSDEPKAARTLIPDGFEFVETLAISEFDDLHLMANTGGGVIANSTFSFWGGLLAQDNGGTIISPKTWRKDGGAQTRPASRMGAFVKPPNFQISGSKVRAL